MTKLLLFLPLATLFFLSACSSVSIGDLSMSTSEASIEKLAFHISREKIEEIFGKESAHAEHEDGIILYYDKQAGHHEIPIAKFAINKKNQLVGKTWYCQKDCESLDLDKFKKRYPAGSFVIGVPPAGRKQVFGPNERIFSNTSAGINVEIDGNAVIAIHWDQPGSSYLNR